MRFGNVPLDKAENALLAHSLTVAGRRLKKGHRLDASDLSALSAAGYTSVVAALLGDDDLHEDEAAETLARRIAGLGVEWRPAATGRANLYATATGVLTIEKHLVDRLNAIDEAITLATLPAFSVVPGGAMLATVKIIPFAVAAPAVEQALTVLRQPLVSVARFTAKTVRLIQTALPGTSVKMLDKTARITAERVRAVGSRLAGEHRCAHDPSAVATAIAAARQEGFDLLLIAGASAITDRQDVLPAGVAAAGGAILRFGMPVDPGNLLLLADLDGRPVLGLPGCARSPKLNGFDWVLERLAADLPISSTDIAGMGVGGLLMEIPSRPQPRDVEPPPSPEIAKHEMADRKIAKHEVAVIVLAAGRSTRMVGANKLLAPVDGAPMVRHAVKAALASKAERVLVVTGHDQRAVMETVADLRPAFVYNPDFANGLSTSLRAALSQLPDDVEAVIVMLGDMPLVSPLLLDRLIDAFDPGAGHTIVVPTHDGQRGNPVLIGRGHFAEMLAITGDVGARHLIGRHPNSVVDLPISDDSALLDIDTPEALDRLLARTKSPA